MSHGEFHVGRRRLRNEMSHFFHANNRINVYSTITVELSFNRWSCRFILVLATCGIHRPELAWENTLSLLLLLADFSAELYNLKH
jgi:hypothetical protein